MISDSCCSHAGHSHEHNAHAHIPSTSCNSSDLDEQRNPFLNSPFKKPERSILTKDDLSRWTESSTCKEILGFIDGLNESIANKKLRDDVFISQVKCFIQIFKCVLIC